MLQLVNRIARVLSVSSKSLQTRKLSLLKLTAQEWKLKLASLHTNMGSNETISLYDEWAGSYDDCLLEWGYEVPAITASLMKTHCTKYDSQQIKVFDLGCGTGLVGKEIIENHPDIDAIMHGSDLSTGQFPMAKEKGYRELKQWNLNVFPFPYDENEFDLLTCAGTLTYAMEKNKIKLFDEWLRITKPGSIIICSHRSDLMVNDLQYFDEMEKNGKWRKLELTDPVPYLPHNENYGMKILVQFYVAVNDKKEQ